MNPNGRDKTRTREDFLIGVYRVVHSRMVALETKSVKEACEHIFANFSSANDIIKFYRERLSYDEVADHIYNAENLRKRVQDARNLAKDELNYPHLSQVVKKLDSQLDELIDQHRSQREFLQAEIKEGRGYLYFNSQKEIDTYLAIQHPKRKPRKIRIFRKA